SAALFWECWIAELGADDHTESTGSKSSGTYLCVWRSCVGPLAARYPFPTRPTDQGHQDLAAACRRGPAPFDGESPGRGNRPGLLSFGKHHGLSLNLRLGVLLHADRTAGAAAAGSPINVSLPIPPSGISQ